MSDCWVLKCPEQAESLLEAFGFVFAAVCSAHYAEISDDRTRWTLDREIGSAPAIYPSPWNPERPAEAPLFPHWWMPGSPSVEP